jgi:hypothetical protein
MLCAVLFLLGTVGLLEAAGKKETSIQLTDSRDSWKLAVVHEDEEKAGDSTGTAAGSLEISLLRYLGQCDFHDYRSEESRRYRDYLLRKKQESIRLSMNELKRKMDILELQEQTEELEKKREEYGVLAAGLTDIIVVPLANRKPVLVEKKRLRGAPEQMLEALDVDALLSFSVEQLGDRYILYAQFLAPFLNDVPEAHRIVFSGKEVDKAARQLSDAVKEDVLGRSWAALAVTHDAEPPTVPEAPRLSLFLEERRVSGAERETLLPGVYVFTLGAPGFREQRLELYLAPNKRREVTVRLEPLETATVRLESLPSGSEVYLNGRYAGISPQYLNFPSYSSVIELNSEGYRPLAFSHRGGDGEYRFSLDPDVYEREQLVEAKRRSFYNAFGVFLLSIPVSMISYGIGMEYAAASEDALTNPGVVQEEQQRLVERNRLWYTAYLGGMFANAFLGTNALFRLLDYINTHETVHGTGRN